MSKSEKKTIREGLIYAKYCPKVEEPNLDLKLKNSYPEGFIKSKAKQSARQSQSKRKQSSSKS